MQKIEIIKSGHVVIVPNNVAHTMIDKGIGRLTDKAFGSAPKDKMVSPSTRKKIKKK